MLDSLTIKKIEDFVYKKPRSIQEIASHIEKNWRTADRYIREIGENYGTIESRVFREGTRGALKIVYWASIEKISYSVFQEQLEKQILNGKTKYDFYPFDIFQHVSSNNKHAWIRKGESEVKLGRIKEFEEILLTAKKEIIFFSGNLSFINFKDDNTDIFKTLEKLVKNNIKIKIICRVDIVGKENIEKMLSLNFKHGKELIEIRHREQPLRVTIIDNNLISLKEIREPTGRKNELNEKTFIFYTIKDREWIEWLSKIFRKMFSSSINANKRLEEMNKILKH